MSIACIIASIHLFAEPIYNESDYGPGTELSSEGAVGEQNMDLALHRVMLLQGTWVDRLVIAVQ